MFHRQQQRFQQSKCCAILIVFDLHKTIQRSPSIVLPRQLCNLSSNLYVWKYVDVDLIEWENNHVAPSPASRRKFKHYSENSWESVARRQRKHTRPDIYLICTIWTNGNFIKNDRRSKSVCKFFPPFSVPCLCCCVLQFFVEQHNLCIFLCSLSFRWLHMGYFHIYARDGNLRLFSPVFAVPTFLQTSLYVSSFGWRRQFIQRECAAQVIYNSFHYAFHSFSVFVTFFRRWKQKKVHITKKKHWPVLFKLKTHWKCFVSIQLVNCVGALMFVFTLQRSIFLFFVHNLFFFCWPCHFRTKPLE